MRHFLCLASPVATLTRRVGVASTRAALVALAGGSGAALAHFAGAVASTVALTLIAAAADEHRGAAASAQAASWGWFHRQKMTDGGWAGPSPAFREILTPATSPSRARGATSVGTCSLWPVSRLLKLLRQDQFYRILRALATSASSRVCQRQPAAPVTHAQNPTPK